MLTLTTLALARKPAPPKETRVAPRPHVRMAHIAKDHVPLRRTVRPVPDEPAREPFGVVRVRGGATYDWRQMDEYSYDAAEARSGLAGHEA